MVIVRHLCAKRRMPSGSCARKRTEVLACPTFGSKASGTLSKLGYLLVAGAWAKEREEGCGLTITGRLAGGLGAASDAAPAVFEDCPGTACFPSSANNVTSPM